MTRFLDQHVHAGASKCSHLTDAQAVAFFLDNPSFVPCVSDHMTDEFYDKYVGPGKTFRADEVLYSMELSAKEPWTDLLLLTYDRAALQPFKPWIKKFGRFLDIPPLKLLDDPRIIVTWAHPEEGIPTWLRNSPVDFLEFNSTHLSLSGLGEFAFQKVQGYHDTAFQHTGFIVGSDSHQGWTLGKTYIEFDSENILTGRDAWDAVKAGSFTCHFPGDYSAKESWTFRPDNPNPISLRKYSCKQSDFHKSIFPQSGLDATGTEFDTQLDGWPDDSASDADEAALTRWLQGVKDDPDEVDNEMARLLDEADELDARYLELDREYEDLQEQIDEQLAKQKDATEPDYSVAEIEKLITERIELRASTEVAKA